MVFFDMYPTLSPSSQYLPKKTKTNMCEHRKRWVWQIKLRVKVVHSKLDLVWNERPLLILK